MDDAGTLQALWETPLFPWAALAVGLVVGSFANVVIHRLPLGLSVVRPRSRCPRCGRAIAAWENVPVLSYLVLRGRCAGCRAPISVRYPLVEAANGLGYFGLAWWFGPSLPTLVRMALLTMLLVLALIDLDHQILPDVLTLPGIAAGLLASALPGPPTPLDAVLAAAGGYLAFWAIAAAYRRTRGIEGLGMGDWKMAGMLGAVFGWEQLLLTIFLAALAGTAVGLSLMAWKGRSARHALPLGTFLGFAGIAVLFVGVPLVDWYRRLYRG